MSLGGKNTKETTIDPDLKNTTLENLAMAKKIGQLGYVPYTGDTVAGMQPGQIAAIQSGNLGANAFGLPTMAVPTGANLNPYAAYEAALAKIPPAQRAFIESLFINQQTGAAPTMAYGAPVAQAAVQQAPQYVTDGGGNGGGGGGGGGGNAYTTMATPRSYLPGGVNASNPNSVLSRIVAAVSGTQKAPTASNRPVARPK